MTSRKRVSLTVQIDVDSEEDPTKALHTVTELIRTTAREQPSVVRCQIHGVAHPIPTDEELAEIQQDREEEWRP